MKNPDEKQTLNRICPYLNNVFHLQGTFTSDECKQIINTALNSWKEQPGEVVNEENNNIETNLDYRNTTTYIPLKSDDWLFTKTFSIIMSTNHDKNAYQFDINGLYEFPNMMKYEVGGHYDWHVDIGQSSPSSSRKLSYTLLLNPGEYEGGELCFHTGRSMEPHPNQHEVGSMFLFPSYMTHKVMPVTKGIRYSLVGWAHGNSFM